VISQDVGFFGAAVLILLFTIGLGSLGGIEAAGFVIVYAIVPLYCGLVASSTACLVATAASTACYLLLVVMQSSGWLPRPVVASTGSVGMAAANLLVLNVVGVLTAALCEAHRRSYRRQVALNEELERANDQAQLLNIEIQRATQRRVLGEVVAGVTHDLGNVLSVASGYLGLARKKAAGAVDVDTHLGHVEESFESAMRIIRHTLQTARQPATGPVLVAVSEMAQCVVDLKAYDLRRDGIAVHVDFPADFPDVCCVPFQLQQVLLNLVTNAQEALREIGGDRAIRIVGLAAAGGIAVEVSDTGPGIPPESLRHVFEPFYTTTKREGAGLGLAIAAEIIRGLGGEITAENGSGAGASFRIRLPAAPVESPTR
jgi:signal transduction histidine kinase